MRSIRWIRRWSLAGLAVVLLTTGCQGPAWESDPDVKAVRIACAGLTKTDHYDCVEHEAIARLNPEVCRLASVALNDLCLQAVYETLNDPEICDRIWLTSVADNCREWYARPNHLPKLGERRPPGVEMLDGCAPDKVQDLKAFEQALAGTDRSFATLCSKLGPPDWETGSGLMILIYEMDDGSEVWLGYGGLEDLAYAVQVMPSGEQVDLD